MNRDINNIIKKYLTYSITSLSKFYKNKDEFVGPKKNCVLKNL